MMEFTVAQEILPVQHLSFWPALTGEMVRDFEPWGIHMITFNCLPSCHLLNFVGSKNLWASLKGISPIYTPRSWSLWLMIKSFRSYLSAISFILSITFFFFFALLFFSFGSSFVALLSFCTAMCNSYFQHFFFMCPWRPY